MTIRQWMILFLVPLAIVAMCLMMNPLGEWARLAMTPVYLLMVVLGAWGIRKMET